MTEPVGPLGHSNLMEQYSAEVEQLDSLPPAAIKLTARQALAIVTHIRIAVANPAVEHHPRLLEAIAAAKQIQSTFNPESAIYEVLELWGSPEDATAEDALGGEQMTEPSPLVTTPSHLELLKRYGAEVEGLDSLPPAAIELSARQALALITHIQIGAANPAVEHNPLLPDAIAGAKQIQSAFNPESAIYEVLELGWDSPQDADTIGERPHQMLRTAPCRPKRLGRPSGLC